VVNLASWTDADKVSLEPHEPESTELVVDLETDTRHWREFARERIEALGVAK
jgi:hypothetical protein